MNAWLSFPYDTFKNNSDAFKFINENLHFKTRGLISSDNSFETDHNRIINSLNSANRDSFTLAEENSPILNLVNSVTYRSDLNNSINLFACSLQNRNALEFDRLVSSASRYNFTTFIVFDHTKSKWQNEKIIENYKTFGKPYEHLAKVWDSELSPALGELIDISKNPGHIKESYTMVLMAAPEIWFGPGCWSFFNKDEIKSFPSAIEINEVLPNVVYIKLYDYNYSDHEAPEILSLQRQFRNWVKMDMIEKELDNKLKEKKNVEFLKIFMKKSKS